MKSAISVFMMIFLLTSVSVEAISQKQLERVEELKKEAVELLRHKEFDKAVPVLNEILSIDPFEKTAKRYLMLARQQSMEPFCKEAATAFMHDDYARAIDIWEKILRMNPDDYRFSRLIEITKNLISDKAINDMYVHADEFLKKGDKKSAINELEKILFVKPSERRAREMLATARQSTSDIRTKKHYKRAEKYMKQKKYDLAIEEWNKILEIDETQQEAKRFIASAIRAKLKVQYARARRLYEKGDYLSARDHYYKIMVDNPTDTNVKSIISNLDETVKIVSRLSRKGKTFDMMRMALKNHIAAEGNRKAAIVAAWYAVQLDPMNSTALAIKNFLEHKYVAILNTLEPPIGDMNIIDQYLFAALNNIYEGRYDRAIEESTIVIELQSDNVLAWKRLGSAYFALGRKDKARKAWKKALKLAPDDAELKRFIRQTK
ncbi:formate-dependent nitrite reductase complex subunit NrfG [bacterium BMS3Bbin05]|nr:formate-dependent nitrite reductase complex subunit NrfG [bacterium BMS3Bbin05]HDO22569.1 tetratricopeptide repeat protein [Nitrospirota bacterium]HDZ87455.1 tetratricopeptide repeat protein [Nitrospirota bacterium]